METDTRHTPGYGFKKPKNAKWQFASEKTPWLVVENDGVRKDEGTRLLVDSEGRVIATCRAVAFNDGPDHILTCVNSHDALVEALRYVKRTADYHGKDSGDEWNLETRLDLIRSHVIALLSQLEGK